jgi:sugar phosphate permease
MTIEKVAPFAKAIIGALVAFLTALATALENGSVSGQEWVTSLIALLVGFGAVFSIPNKPEQTDSVQ